MTWGWGIKIDVLHALQHYYSHKIHLRIYEKVIKLGILKVDLGSKLREKRLAVAGPEQATEMMEVVQALCRLHKPVIRTVLAVCETNMGRIE